jgi:hypothetical protein
MKTTVMVQVTVDGETQTRCCHGGAQEFVYESRAAVTRKRVDSMLRGISWLLEAFVVTPLVFAGKAVRLTALSSAWLAYEGVRYGAIKMLEAEQRAGGKHALMADTAPWFLPKEMKAKQLTSGDA